MTDEQERPTPKEVNEIIELGKVALRRLVGQPKKDLMDWFKVHAGIRQGAIIVARSLRMNSPNSESTIFNRALKTWRAKNGYGAIDRASGGKTTLSHLSWLAERREYVLAWFNGLPEGERLHLNHPSTVFRRFRKHLLELGQLANESTQEKGEETDMREVAATPLVESREPLSVLRPLALIDNDDMAALAFFDTYGNRADSVLRAILKHRAASKRGVNRDVESIPISAYGEKADPVLQSIHSSRRKIRP